MPREDPVCGQEFGGSCPEINGGHLCGEETDHSGNHVCTFCGASG